MSNAPVAFVAGWWLSLAVTALLSRLYPLTAAPWFVVAALFSAGLFAFGLSGVLARP